MRCPLLPRNSEIKELRKDPLKFNKNLDICLLQRAQRQLRMEFVQVTTYLSLYLPLPVSLSQLLISPQPEILVETPQKPAKGFMVRVRVEV